MSRRIPEEVIESILKAHDIADVVGRHVDLTKQGRYLKGLCPFHSEKTPSFTVTPEKQIYHCFGCQAGGNAIHFIMAIEGLSFTEALKQMAEEAQIAVDWEPVSEKQTQEQLEAAKLYEAYQFAAQFYHYVMKNTEQGKEALHYLRQRGITDKLIDFFQLGYSPNMRDKLAELLEKRGFELALMEKGGLLSRWEDSRYYDKFRDRIMYPIHDQRGRVIAFGGRAMNDTVQPKYMNSPESSLFNKSRQVYHLHQARSHIRKHRSVVLLEGYMDVIKVWEAGIYYGVATMGTALTREHASLLRRSADEAIICYDGDSAGLSAAYKSIDLLEEHGFHVKAAWLPDRSDPDDYIRQHGAEQFRQQIIDGALTALQFKLLYIRKNFNMQEVDGRFRYIEAALKLIAALESPIEREHYVRELAIEFPYAADNLMQQMQEYRHNLFKKGQRGDNPDHSWNNIINNGNTKPKIEIKPAHLRAESALLSAMLHERDAALQIQEQLGDGFTSELHAVLAAYIYSYYAQGNHPNISKFIAMLDDQELEREAASISMEDPQPALAALDQYIRYLQLYPQLKLLEEREAEAVKLKDQLEAARQWQAIRQVKKDIQTLEKQLKSL